MRLLSTLEAEASRVESRRPPMSRVDAVSTNSEVEAVCGLDRLHTSDLVFSLHDEGAGLL